MKAFAMVSSFSYYQCAIRLYHNLRRFHPDIDVFLLLCEKPWEKSKLKIPKGLQVVTMDQIEPDYHHWMQQPGWCTLVQSVADDCLSIEQVVYGAGDDYPGLAP